MTLELLIRTRKPNVGMLVLPTEIISAICCLLCFHCRLGCVVDAMPDAVGAAYEDQKAISRLSRCSKRLRDIAQPVLFHWYHDLEEESPIRLEKHLTFFVDAIIRNPDLAASVKALAFYKPALELKYGDGFLQNRARPQRPVYNVDEIFHRTAKDLGRGHLKRIAKFEVLHPPYMEELQDLAMAISPGLSQLCVQKLVDYWDNPDDEPEEGSKNYNWRCWAYDMRSLTYLAFPGARDGNWNPLKETTYHIHEAKSLLRHTPNLRTLIAPDCAGGHEQWARRKYENEPWDVPLPKLKRLSLNGITVPELERIIYSCPVLEDLEFYEAPESEFEWLVLNPERYLGHTRTTLRRLCYSVLFDGAYMPSNHDDGGDGSLTILFYNRSGVGDGHGLGAFPSGLSFSSFPVLEELELEQLLLYGPIFSPSYTEFPAEGYSLRETTSEGFLAKLPPSLRRLRLGGIIYWPATYRDLVALAEQSSRFPKLEAIALEVYATPPRDEYRHLVEVFRAASNLSVSIFHAVGIPSPGSRGLLPARPGHTEVAPTPIVWGES